MSTENKSHRESEEEHCREMRKLENDLSLYYTTGVTPSEAAQLDITGSTIGYPDEVILDTRWEVS